MPTCFVIGPIGDKFAPLGSMERERYEEALEIFEKVILPACVDSDLDPVRADQIAISGEITEQVFRHLYEDDVVIADVSGGNPNVMYELGLRHTRELLTIHIGEYGQLPFDIKDMRVIQFSRSERGLIDARKALLRAIQVGLAEGGDPVTATRVWLNRQTPNWVGNVAIPAETIAALSSEAEEVNEDGLVERVARVEEVFPRLSQTTESLAGVLMDLGASAEEMGREINLIVSSGQPASARLAATHRFAATMQGPADEITRLVISFVEDMREIDGSVNGILDFLGHEPEARRMPSNQEFLAAIIETAKASRQGMEGVGQFANIVGSLGSTSKALRGPGEQMAQAILEMANSISLMDEWESAAVRLKDKVD